MSPATSVVNGSIRRSADLSSSGTTIPTHAFPCQIPRRDHKDALTTRQVSQSRSILVEILRTNDLVLISFIELILKAERVAYFVADQHMAAVEGSSASCRGGFWSTEKLRVRVSWSKRVWEKNCAMPDPSAELDSASTADGLTEDRWLGGRLMSHSEARPSGRDGRRPPRCGGGRRSARPIVDVGAGVGAVGLALAERSSLASVDLLEMILRWRRCQGQCGAQRASVAHARLTARRPQPEGAPRSGAGGIGRLRRHQPAVLRRRGGPRLSDESKARAHVLAGARPADACRLDSASLAILAPGGRFVMIHRPDALSLILAAIGNRLGTLAILPVHPAIGASAHRLLVSGVKAPRPRYG